MHSALFLFTMMKRNITILYAIGLLQGMVFYGPVATLYRQAQGVGIFEITAIESISLLLCIVLEVPWGVLADRIGYRKTMVFCSGLYFVSKIVFWQAESFGAFLLERVMLSIVIAGLSGVDTSILYLSCGAESSHRVFGIYNGLQTAGLLAAALVFSLFIRDNYPISALLTVLSYGLAAILALFLKEVKGEKQRIDGQSFRQLLTGTLKDKRLLLLLLAMAFLSESHQTITVFLNQLQYEKCGLESAAIGGIYIVVSLVGLMGVFSFRLTEKLGRKRTAALLFASAAAACLVLSLTASAALSAASILVLRLSNSLFEPLQTELQNRQTDTSHRATAMSIYAMIINSVAIVTNLIFGSLAERNLSTAFLFGFILCSAGLVLFFLWHKGVSRIN